MAQTGLKATFKQKKFALEYVKNNGNGSKAALAAYDTNSNNAHVIASQNLDKPVVQKEIKKILDKAGLTLETVSEGLREVFLAGVERIEKATPDHAIAIGNMVYKLNDAYPGKINKSMHLRVDASAQPIDIATDITELREMKAKTDKLLAYVTRNDR